MILGFVFYDFFKRKFYQKRLKFGNFFVLIFVKQLAKKLFYTILLLLKPLKKHHRTISHTPKTPTDHMVILGFYGRTIG